MSRIASAAVLMFAMGVTAFAPTAAHAAEERPAASVADKRVNEPGSGTRRARFFVRLNQPATVRTVVAFRTVAGTATAGADFNSRRGRVAFRPGERTRFVDVQIRADTADERNERFTLRISAPTNVPAASRPRIADGSARGTIVDVDPPPTIRMFGTSVRENEGPARFRVTLSRETYRAVTVNFATKAGTAIETDFVARSGRLSIPAGAREGFIDVGVRNDLLDENDERFSVQLTGPVGGRITRGTANATIVDEDSPRLIAISDTTVSESTGTAQVVIATSPGTQPLTVSYATHSGTATQGVDFTQTVGSATIPANATSTTISVPIATDFLDEPAETFAVRIVNPVGGAIVDSEAIVTILDVDTPPTVTVTSVSGPEGNTGITQLFPTILLSKESGLPVTVSYRTVDVTATAGSDYTAVSSTVTFQPGETSKAVTIPVIGDTVVEPNETLRLEITATTNATAPANTFGTVTIQNDDA